VLASILVLSLVGCKKEALVPPSDLGSIPQDAAKLADVPELAHLAAVYAGGAQATVADLFRTTSFSAAPDPSELLRADQASNAAHANEGTPLRLLDYNIALLDVHLFGLIPYKRTPFLDERRGELPALILGAGYDIVGLEEVWQPQDLAAFEAEAKKDGYLSFHGPRDQYDDGVLVLIKGELVAPGTTPALYAEPYEAQDPLEFSPGPKMKRGYVEVAFQHPTLGKVLVYTTHMLAFPDKWAHRMSEARQLGRRVAGQVGPEGLAFVMGDMNAGPYYPTDTWTPPKGDVETGWWANSASYPLLRYYGGLSDLYLRGRPAEEATADVELGNKLVELGKGKPNDQVIVSEVCPDLLFPDRYTVSDCDVLYEMQYKDTEYPTRMDLVLAADPKGRVYVTGSKTAFTERKSFGGSPEMEPSDHLAVAVDLRVAGPQGADPAPSTEPVPPSPAE